MICAISKYNNTIVEKELGVTIRHYLGRKTRLIDLTITSTSQLQLLMLGLRAVSELIWLLVILLV